MARKRKLAKKSRGFTVTQKRSIMKALKGVHKAHGEMHKAHKTLQLKVQRVTAMLEGADFIQL